GDGDQHPRSSRPPHVPDVVSGAGLHPERSGSRDDTGERHVRMRRRAVVIHDRHRQVEDIQPAMGWRDRVRPPWQLVARSTWFLLCLRGTESGRLSRHCLSHPHRGALMFRQFSAVLLLSFPIAIAAPTAAAAQDVHLEKAKRVLQAVPLVDGHNDLPWYIRAELPQAPLDVEAYDLRRPTSGNTDLARLQRGMVGGQFWSVYVPGAYRDSGFAGVQLEQIDIARRVIAKYPDVLQRA